VTASSVSSIKWQSVTGYNCTFHVHDLSSTLPKPVTLWGLG